MKIAIIGAGLIGRSWAVVFARGGCDVSLWDGQPDVARCSLDAIFLQAKNLESHGLIPGAEGIRDRLQACDRLEDAIAGASHVQENLPERRDVKREIFARLDQLAQPETTIASSTSSLPSSEFTENLAGRARCLVAHPVNPPHLAKVVELCGAPWTASFAIDKVGELMRRVGQSPVVVRREIGGFVINRLQGALLREAFRLVDEGIVDMEGVDLAVKEGLGPRWAFMGPFETIDLNAPAGLKDYCERYGAMYQGFRTELPEERTWSDALVTSLDAARRALVPADRMGDRRQWRDAQLMSLALQKKQAEAAD